MSSTLGRRILALIPVLMLGACDVGINKHITIAPGEKTGGAAVVNGGIDVGDGAEVSGDLSTVNGDITVERNASVRAINMVNGRASLGVGASATSVKCVNGGVVMAETASLSRSIKLTNGEISLAPGAEVGSDIGIVAGSVELRGAQVKGDVTTVAGDVELAGESSIAGSLRVDKPDGVVDADPPTIIVGPGSRIVGPLVFEAPARVFVSDRAQIGEVSGVLSAADVVRYEGDAPPVSED